MRSVDRLTGTRAGRAVTAGIVLADALVLASIARHASTSRWRLIGDPAITVLRGRDVLSANTPLLGMPSGFNAWSSAADPFHPGPVALWMLAPTRIFGAGEGVVLVISWVLLVASTVVIAAAARRVAGWWAAAGAVTIAVAFQQAVAFSPIWTAIPPVLAIMPALALCFVAWVVADGKTAWWPALIVIGAMVAGADLAFATLVFPLVVLAAARTVRDERRTRACSAPSTISRRTAVATIIAVVVTCALPLIQAVTNGGGNLAELLAAAGARVPVAGPSRALDALGDIVFPETFRLVDWANVNEPIRVRVAIVLTVFAAFRYGLRGRRLAGVVVGCVVVWNLINLSAAPELFAVLGPISLICLAVVGFRESRPGTLPLLAVAGTTVAGALLGQWQTPAAAPLASQYLYPVQVATAITWFAVGLLAFRGASALLARRPAPEAHRSAPAAHPLAPWLRCVPVVAAGLLLLALFQSGHDAEDLYLQATAQGLGTLAAEVDAELPDGTYHWQPVGGLDASATSRGLLLRLIPRGITPHVGPGDAKYYGPGRRIDGSERSSVYLTLGSGPPPLDGARLVARWDPPSAVDAGVVAALADRIRSHGLAIEPDANSGTLGSLALGFGGLSPSEEQILDDQFDYDQFGFDLGERLRDDPEELASMPDEAIIELASQSMVDTDWLSDADLATIESIQDAYPISVWQMPIGSAG